MIRKTAQTRRTTSTWMWMGILALLAVIAIGALWIANQNNTAPAAQWEAGGLPAEIDVATAYEKYEAGAFVLDVRTQEEWEKYHIPGATLIPLDQLPNRLSELPVGREIVVVCRSGNRSQQGRELLKNAGFEQATSVAGGVIEWRSAGYPIEP